MEITISLETLFRIGYVLLTGVLLGLTIIKYNGAKALLAESKTCREDAERALADNKKLMDRGDAQWMSLPGFARNQVRDNVFTQMVDGYNRAHPEDLQCLMLLHRNLDGDALNVFHRKMMGGGQLKDLSYDNGPLHDMLQLMVSATVHMERTKPGALAVMTVLLDNEREKLNA